jgi:putative oxidoreductase
VTCITYAAPVSSYDDRTTSTSSSTHGGNYGHSDSQSDTTVLHGESGYEESPPREKWRLGWNSGADLGLLVMRLVVGLTFAAHGAQKVFGWWRGPGLDGFAANLTTLGFRQTDLLSAITGFTELVGGILLILGLFTPLAAAALLAISINAVWVRWGSGLFLADGGYEYDLALAALTAGLTLTGPGRVALDYGRAWFRHSVVSGWFCLLVGVAAAIAVRYLLHG